jgi:uncharacterized protein YfaS (alpha-2-macroglobulin family)
MVVGLLGTFLLIGSLAWAKIAVAPASLDFHTVKPGSTTTLPLTVTGVGGAKTNNVKVKVTVGSSVFSAAPTSFTVKKNHSTTVTVTFKPTAIGKVTGTLTVNAISVPLQGDEENPTATPTPTPSATVTVTPTATPTPRAITGSQPIPLGRHRWWLP